MHTNSIYVVSLRHLRILLFTLYTLISTDEHSKTDVHYNAPDCHAKHIFFTSLISGGFGVFQYVEIGNGILFVLLRLHFEKAFCIASPNPNGMRNRRNGFSESAHYIYSTGNSTLRSYFWYHIPHHAFFARPGFL